MSFPALTFCNDIDFADWDTYKEVHKILDEEFGIIATDSFWLFDPNGCDLALFKGSTGEKGDKHDELLEEIKLGRLNILHSAGNFSKSNTALKPSRQMIAEALDYLLENARVPQIWTNHGDIGDIQNIGGTCPQYQQGDNPASDTYILDILLQQGIKFFWLDHHSSNNFVFNNCYSGSNSLWIQESSRSGFQITCFRRFRGALAKAPTALTLGEQLSEENLQALAVSQGVTVIYQHWCCHRDVDGKAITARRPIFPKSSMSGLKRLATFRDHEQITILPLQEFLDLCISTSSLEITQR